MTALALTEKSRQTLTEKLKLKCWVVPSCKGVKLIFFFLVTGFASFPSFFYSLLSSACCPLPPWPRLPPWPYLPSPQLNLIHSEVSNLAGFDVEGVINPTTAELELKDDLGETPRRSTWITVRSLEKEKSLNVSALQSAAKRVTSSNVTIHFHYLFHLF